MKRIIFVLSMLILSSFVLADAPTTQTSSIYPVEPVYSYNSLLGFCNATDDNELSSIGYYYEWYKNDVLQYLGDTVGTPRNMLIYTGKNWTNPAWGTDYAFGGLATDGEYLWYAGHEYNANYSTIFKEEMTGGAPEANYTLPSYIEDIWAIEYYNNSFYIIDGDDYIAGNFIIYNFPEQSSFSSPNWNITMEKPAACMPGFQMYDIAIVGDKIWAVDVNCKYVPSCQIGSAFEYDLNGNLTGNAFCSHNLNDQLGFIGIEYYNSDFYISGYRWSPFTTGHVAKYSWNGSNYEFIRNYTNLEDQTGVTNLYRFEIDEINNRLLSWGGARNESTYAFDFKDNDAFYNKLTSTGVFNQTLHINNPQPYDLTYHNDAYYIVDYVTEEIHIYNATTGTHIGNWSLPTNTQPYSISYDSISDTLVILVQSGVIHQDFAVKYYTNGTYSGDGWDINSYCSAGACFASDSYNGILYSINSLDDDIDMFNISSHAHLGVIDLPNKPTDSHAIYGLFIYANRIFYMVSTLNYGISHQYIYEIDFNGNLIRRYSITEPDFDGLTEHNLWYGMNGLAYNPDRNRIGAHFSRAGNTDFIHEFYPVSSASYVDASDTSEGENWTLKCRANDGFSNSSSQITSSVTYIDYVTTIDIVNITPGIAYTNTTLETYCRAQSINENDVAYEYKIYKNSAYFDGGTTTSTPVLFEQEQHNGTYTTGAWGPPGAVWANAVDSNYGTWARRAWPSNGYGFVNYTKPVNAGGATWFVHRSRFDTGANSTTNISIPDECWNAFDDKLAFRLDSDGNIPGNANYCWNGNSWQWLWRDFSGQRQRIHEEKIYWHERVEYTEGVTQNLDNISTVDTAKNDNFTISCRAITDEYFSVWTDSGVLNILNLPPVILSARTNTNVADNETLIGYCNSSDIDGDNIDYEFRWYKDNSLFSSGNFTNVSEGIEYNIGNITANNLSSGEEWILSCKAFDSEENSQWLNSSSITINSSGPIVMDSVSILPPTAYTNNVLTGVCQATEENNDTITFDYIWYLNESDVGNGVISGQLSGESINVSTLSSDVFDKGDNIIFSCNATSDVSSQSTGYVNSSILTISNSPPSFVEIDFEYSISHGQNISLQINATDLNDDNLFWGLNDTRFDINGTGVINKTNSVSDVGLYNVTVYVNDSFDVTNGWIFFNITNTKPTISDVYILPAGGDPNINITCVNVTTDVDDDDIIDWSIKWYIDDVYNSSFDNQSIIEAIYTINETSWVCSLASSDYSGFSDYYNSSPYKFGDGNPPVLSNAQLERSSGTNDEPFDIFVDITEENVVSYVYVEITDPNYLVFNFSMTLDSGVQNDGTYKRIYIPGTDGIYSFRFFSRDGTSNTVQLNSSLTYTESTEQQQGGGGGGGLVIIGGKEDCDIEFSKSTIIIDGTEPYTLEMYNAGDQTWAPSVILSDDIKFLEYTLPTSTIAAGRQAELNIINDDEEISIDGTLTMTSANCNDIIFNVKVSPRPLGAEFFTTELFSIGTFAITNIIILLLGLALGGGVALTRKKLPPGTKLFIAIVTALSLLVIFNFIF